MANEIVKQEPLQEYLAKPETIQQFIGLFPNDTAAKRHIESVLLLVATSDPGEYSLQNCTNESILRSALRAASLRVSVDPALRQAWLVPRRNKKQGGKLEGNLQLHYQEIYNRAMRTGRYRTINVSPIYDGQIVYYDVYTGLHYIEINGLMTRPNQKNALVRVDERKGKQTGWLGYFETFRGSEKTAYMSIDDIVKHVSVHNPFWTSNKAWRENRETMEKKTVLLALLRQADLGDQGMSELRHIIEDEQVETVDATFDAEPFGSDSVREPHTLEENMAALYGGSASGGMKEAAQELGAVVGEVITDPDTKIRLAGEMLSPKGAKLKTLKPEQWAVLADSTAQNVTDEMREAARTLLKASGA